MAYPTTPSFQTARLSLDPVQETDWQGYAPIWRSEETARYTDFPNKRTDKKGQIFVKRMATMPKRKTGWSWMIRRDGQIIGAMRLFRINNKKSKTAALGYELAEDAWGQGMMTEAATPVMAFAFDDADLFRVEAWALGGNIASQRVLEKLGFQQEGRLRQNFVNNFGRHDELLYGILASDVSAS